MLNSLRTEDVVVFTFENIHKGHCVGVKVRRALSSDGNKGPRKMRWRHLKARVQKWRKLAF